MIWPKIKTGRLVTDLTGLCDMVVVAVAAAGVTEDAEETGNSVLEALISL